jgi:hypothetical protein
MRFASHNILHAAPDLFDLADFLFDRIVLRIQPFPLGGQLAALVPPSLNRQSGSAVHHAFEIAIGGFKRNEIGAMIFVKRLTLFRILYLAILLIKR